MIHKKIHLISPGCPRPTIALTLQNCGLKHQSFHLYKSNFGILISNISIYHNLIITKETTRTPKSIVLSILDTSTVKLFCRSHRFNSLGASNAWNYLHTCNKGIKVKVYVLVPCSPVIWTVCVCGPCYIHPGCLWPSIALTVQNHCLKHHSFIHYGPCYSSVSLLKTLEITMYCLLRYF